MTGNHSSDKEQDAYGSVIREAREKKGFRQEELGNFIGVSMRSIGEWERGGSPSPEHKQALVECLEIEPALIGAVQQYDFSSQEALVCSNRTASYLNMAMFNSAFISSDFLVCNLRRQVEQQNNTTLLRPLIDAFHLAGHTVSIARDDAKQALDYYQQMEHYVLRLKEDDLMRPTLLSLARTYQGEMRRRMRDLEGAICAFLNAPQGPEVDTLVRGNRAQLLARAYTNLGDPDSMTEARRQLDRSLDLLSDVQKSDSGIYVCYNSCGTYIEYARYYWNRNNIKESLRHIEFAEQYVSQAPRWQIPVLINKSKLLMHKTPRSRLIPGFATGEEFEEGMSLLLKAIDLAHKAGHQRQLSQIVVIKNNLFFQAKEYVDAGWRLNEKFDSLDKLSRNIVD